MVGCYGRQYRASLETRRSSAARPVPDSAPRACAQPFAVCGMVRSVVRGWIFFSAYVAAGTFRPYGHAAKQWQHPGRGWRNSKHYSSQHLVAGCRFRGVALQRLAQWCTYLPYGDTASLWQSTGRRRAEWQHGVGYRGNLRSRDRQLEQRGDTEHTAHASCRCVTQ